MIGPTADAETTTIINEYYDELEASGYSDEVCEKVIAELKPENLPKQYFFRTQEAVEAVEFLIKTTVYAALMDEGTDLYLESRESVLDILKEELAGNPYRLLQV